MQRTLFLLTCSFLTWAWAVNFKIEYRCPAAEVFLRLTHVGTWYVSNRHPQEDLGVLYPIIITAVADVLVENYVVREIL
jgi:hypothetical protein